MFILWGFELLLNLVTKLRLFYKDKSDESKILVLYRFISIIITATFYLLNNPKDELLRRAMIIMCLLVSSLILSYLYPLYEKSQNSIKFLVIIETVGNVILVMPSGGIRSPFIWYSLNSILYF